MDVSETLFPRAAGKIPASVARAESGCCCESPGWMLAQCLESWGLWEVLGRAGWHPQESRNHTHPIPPPSIPME